eukprot:1857849-Rhodomonas_salina.1
MDPGVASELRPTHSDGLPAGESRSILGPCPRKLYSQVLSSCASKLEQSGAGLLVAVSTVPQRDGDHAVAWERLLRQRKRWDGEGRLGEIDTRGASAPRRRTLIASACARRSEQGAQVMRVQR